MLQQTRVATVTSYYVKFLDRFPNVESLARAHEDELLAVWSGLGYYSRARNMRKAAQQIVQRGAFPRDYENLRRLPGVGDYTAAAIASIAFDLPRPVLDGNVLRVLSRMTNESGDIDSPATRKKLLDEAGRRLDPRHPGLWNQALMELGATVCLPKEPKCPVCPVSRTCEARRLGNQRELPVRSRRIIPERVERTLLLVERDGSLLLRKRTAGARLRGFWELPDAACLPAARRIKKLGQFRHSITNHNYVLTLVSARVKNIPTGFEWIPRTRIHEIPLSTTTRKALAASQV